MRKCHLTVCVSMFLALTIPALIFGTPGPEETGTEASKEKEVDPEGREHTITTVEPGPGGKLTFTLTQGNSYIFTFKAWEMEITTEPQIAFWVEDTSGNNVATVFVTFKYATQDWFVPAGMKRAGVRRPSSLPVWTRRHKGKGIQTEELCKACHERHKVKGGPTEPEAPLDAVTGATPKWGFTREWAIPVKLDPGKYVVMAEINNAMDPNDAFWVASEERTPDETDPDYGGTSGQPAVLWSGKIEVGDAGSSVILTKSGHGQPAGKDGSVTADLSRLTTALEIVESIKVDYTPPE